MSQVDTPGRYGEVIDLVKGLLHDVVLAEALAAAKGASSTPNPQQVMAGMNANARAKEVVTDPTSITFFESMGALAIDDGLHVGDVVSEIIEEVGNFIEDLGLTGHYTDSRSMDFMYGLLAILNKPDPHAARRQEEAAKEVAHQKTVRSVMKLVDKLLNPHLAARQPIMAQEAVIGFAKDQIVNHLEHMRDGDTTACETISRIIFRTTVLACKLKIDDAELELEIPSFDTAITALLDPE